MWIKLINGIKSKMCNSIHKAVAQFKFIILFLIAIIVFMSIAFVSSAESTQVKHVLLLQSYYHGHPWEDDITDSIKSTFHENRTSIRLTIQYMDTKRAKSVLHYKNLIALYKEKFKKDVFDLIMANDDNALFFALDHRAELFNNAPIVFSGVSHFPAERLKDEKNVTGIVQHLEFKKTFELAFKIHPKMSHLIVINDQSSSGIKRTLQIKKALSELKHDLPYSFYDNLTVDELQKLLQKADSNTVLFFHLFNRDRTGRSYSIVEISQLFKNYFTGPIYATLKSYLGHGILGGYLSDGNIHGPKAAEMAIEILNGKKAKDIPVLIKNIDLPAFSYPQLVKQGISEDQLPENSIIHNKPFSFYQKYKVRIYLVGTIISLLLFSILILIFDIIMRKKGEKKLLSLRNYLSNIIDSMPSILIGVDTKGKVTQWNSKAKHITGLPPEDALGQSLDKVIPRLATDMELIHSAMQTCEIKIDRKRVHREKGETLFEDITIYPLIANGIEGAVVRIDDVTEQVCIEEMMVQSEKMLSVGGLAAGMAHEINNPMAGILQTSIVMSNRLTDTEMPANKKVAEEIGIKMDDIKTFMEKRDIPRMVTTIIESGKRVAEIVGNMLSFARKGDSSVSSHNLAELFDKILELAATDYDIKKQYDFKAIEIVKEYEDNLPMVPCGGAKIQQVLLNILRNGAEAMHDVMEKNSEYRPKFTLRLFREIKVNMLCIEIEDNGPGMDEIIRKRIFEPFFTTKAVGVGTGLGLSVSYFIITENHDGEMSVESTPGLGAKFIIRLPLEVRKG